MFIIVAYDVPADRTEKYRKLLSRYLISVQYSVFGGDLTQIKYKQMHDGLKRIKIDADRLLIVSSENRRNIRVIQWDEDGESENLDHLGSGIV